MTKQELISDQGRAISAHWNLYNLVPNHLKLFSKKSSAHHIRFDKILIFLGFSVIKIAFLSLHAR